MTNAQRPGWRERCPADRSVEALAARCGLIGPFDRLLKALPLLAG